jgi:hypothetical protein
MHRHRFLDIVTRQPSAPVPAAVGAFTVCPLVLVQGVFSGLGAWQRQLYQLAFAQAQAAVRQPSLWERALEWSRN